MSNYFPHYRKKIEALARREQELIRAIQRGENERKIEQAAAAVHATRAAVLRAARSQLAPDGRDEVRFRRLSEQIEACLKTPVGAVVAEFRARRDEA